MKKTQGIALVTVLILLAVVASLVAVSSLLALTNRTASSNSILSIQATYAAEAGIEMALNRAFYNSLTSWQASTDRLIVNSQGQTVSFDNCAFKKWLTGIYTDPAEIMANNAKECNYVNFLATVPTPPFATLVNNATVTMNSPTTGAFVLGTGDYSVSITRRDDSVGDITLIMSSLGTAKSSNGSLLAQRRISRTVKIASDAFEGDKYAMLTTAANCSFCHLQIDTMRRAYATSGSYDQARVGFITRNNTLDLGPNHGDPDVIIYGSIYSRLSSASSLRFADNTDKSNGTGAAKGARWATTTDGKVSAGSNATNVGGVFLDPANNTALGTARDAATSPWFKTPGEKLYYNYPTQAQVDDPNGIYKGKWPDGPLPDGFPAAIPDGGNSHISDLEWSSYVGTAPQGRIKTVNSAVVYGVRRPTSGTAAALVGTDIPWVYDPISANGLADSAAVIPANAATVTSAPGSYAAWLMMQALVSPNNRDYLPTNPAATSAATAFSTTPINGSFLNNFFVNYNPTSSRLDLSYCGFVGTANWSNCARGGDTSANPSANNLSTLSIGSVTDRAFFPQTSNSALTDLQTRTNSARAGLFNGNVIMDAGTLGDTTRRSLELEGTILINGDLVIRGKIYGSGRIVVRGNIYVVGDTVYACPTVSGTVVTQGARACGVSDYATPDNLPRLALLAGGHIIAGDYDAPDSRMGPSGRNNRAFDLTNDQGGQNRRPSANVPWSFWSVPGSTGRAPRDTNDTNSIISPPNYGDSNWEGRAGFLTRTLQNPNQRTGIQRVYRMNPHGFMLSSSDGSPGEGYEDSGQFITTTAATVSLSPLYPSNGPVIIGNASGSGVVAGTLGADIGCSRQNTANPTQDINAGTIVTNMPVRRFVNQNVTTTAGTPRAPLNFAFWCPPNAGAFVRNSTAVTTANANPSNTAGAWMAQNTSDIALDGGIGSTTGWLGGAVQYRGTWYRGDVSQTRLLKLMWLSTMEGTRASGPFRTDGLYYTANMIASMIRRTKDDRNTPQTSTQARWIHNGSVIAAELGFLITGNAPGDGTARATSFRPTNINFNPGAGTTYSTADSWGPGIGVFYDDRLSGFLQVLNAKPVQIKRTGVFAQVVTK